MLQWWALLQVEDGDSMGISLNISSRSSAGACRFSVLLRKNKPWLFEADFATEGNH